MNARGEERKEPLESDRDDAVRLRRGDMAGLEGLLARHQDRLYRYLLRLTGNQAMAEDVFQQAWVRVAEQVARYDVSRPFLPWLFTLARNLALDQLRRTQPASLEAVEEPAAPLGAGEPADPLACVAAAQRAERLSAALDDLPPLDREVLALRFEEELSLSGIAATLGVPLPTAKARLYRALERLRRALVARAPREEWT
jgi:RNA polymerase sigma-70 factor (ECF subfamily)